MRFLFRVALSSVLLAALSACAPARDAVVVDRLYFGSHAAGVQVVDEAAWAAFLEEVVTPRFPGGFTAWPAQGQWRRADGVVERESSFVLEIVHPGGRDLDAAVEAIVAEYKRRFRQESVLRVVVPARASF